MYVVRFFPPFSPQCLFFKLLVFKISFFFFFRLNCVILKDLLDSATVIYFSHITKVLQMERVGTASRIVIVGYGSQTMSLLKKGLDGI